MKTLQRILLPLFLGAMVASALIIAGCDTDNPASPGSSETTIEQQVQQLINQHRASKGLPALTLNAMMTTQARNHSQNMADGMRPFSHEGFEEERVPAIRQAVAIVSWAENVGLNQGFADPAVEAVQGWLNSQLHRENIEGDYDITGIGVVKNGEGVYYFTQIFAKRQ